MTISAALVKQLREQTGAGMMDAKKALKEAQGDLEKAVEILRKSGQEIVQKKQARAVKEGCIGSYLHANGRVASLVEILCETDFVARNQDFQSLAHDLAMQVAAMHPVYLAPADVPARELSKEKEILRDSAALKNKPAQIQDKIIQGKLEKYYSEICLLKQPFFKDEKITVEELIAQVVSRLKENIQVGRFVYLSL